MQNDIDHKIEQFVRPHFHGSMDTLRQQRDVQRLAISADLAARGHGVALNPLDPRFDDVEVAHCNAVLQAKACALFEAYEVYGMTPDHLWQELNSHHRQLVDAAKHSLQAQAGMRAARRGENASTDVARAEELGRKIERSSHATMKSLACQVEKRKHMLKSENGQHINFTQNVYGDADSVAQGHSVTVAVTARHNIFNSIGDAINDNVHDSQERAALLAALGSLEQTKDKPSFLERINGLTSLANNCVQLAPHVPTWFAALHLYANQLLNS
jgi:hypothetical protein